MKKILLILITVFLNTVLFSCTPDPVSETSYAEQATGDEDGEILPKEDKDDGDND